jgi:hypothetical protein
MKEAKQAKSDEIDDVSLMVNCWLFACPALR